MGEHVDPVIQAAYGLEPTIRLRWWVFPPVANKRRQRPRGRYLDFYSVELAHKHAAALKSEHGADYVVFDIREKEPGIPSRIPGKNEKHPRDGNNHDGHRGVRKCP